jgi:UDP-N-acetylmuramate--alanine ligase
VGDTSAFKIQGLPKKIHFIGIGGAGMSPLAFICLKSECDVTGSDKAASQITNQLSLCGADVWVPHSEVELRKRSLPELVVVSTAITDDNEELVYLKENNVPIIHRSDLLAMIASKFKKQVVISGTHGKTTTTGMLVWMLEKTGKSPSWVLGGQIAKRGSYGIGNNNEIFVFEGDESDQSFLKSEPYVGLVTSVEPDHLENYKNSFEEQVFKFKEFAQKSKKFVCGLDCCNSREKLSHMAAVKYGFRDFADADWSLIDSEDLFLPKGFTDWVGPLRLPKAPGYHNSLNAVGAMAAYFEATGDEINQKNIDGCIEALSSFPGIHRRFEIIGETESGVVVVDDYAHHPTEVKAAINAGKRFLAQRNKGGKLIVAFQPHLPTRLRDLWKEFTECFQSADELFLNDLYVARGRQLEGINSEALAKEIKHDKFNPATDYIKGGPQTMISPIISRVCPNDLILILGAGDITTIREALLKQLSNASSEQSVSWI